MDGYYIGLMSGTSCDGIDGVIAAFSDNAVNILASDHLSFDSQLKGKLDFLQQRTFSSSDPFELAAVAANELTDCYAVVVNHMLQKTTLSPQDIRAIGCHGQTIRHWPALSYSLQISNPAQLVEKTGIAVISDWRNRDMAAKGQGAPLVPAFHQWLFGKAGRIVANLGGIANITDLSTGIGFDSGPANTLMDNWIMSRLKKPYDHQGDWAASGKVIQTLLIKLLAEPYFHKAPPKSTGRDIFSLKWLERHLVGDEKPEDIQATLLFLTAKTVSDAIIGQCLNVEEVLLCGGGVYNRALRQALDRLLPVKTKTTEEVGLDPMLVEATAFAWLARQTWNNLTGNLPCATGASGDRVLGAIYPV